MIFLTEAVVETEQVVTEVVVEAVVETEQVMTEAAVGAVVETEQVVPEAAVETEQVVPEAAVETEEYFKFGEGSAGTVVSKYEDSVCNESAMEDCLEETHSCVRHYDPETDLLGF